ncbi:MAG: protein-methionine-sulfoxide reductase catalytic subunit MsrP [Acidobacteria bacterium]|nr:protein-methionine-sulfoxide reductase catalytic subunit MsrP [Acidobacteriota bacterium]
MLIKKRRGWEIPEREVTPESVYINRRELLRGLGIAGVGLSGACATSTALATGGLQAERLQPFPDSVKYPSGPAGDLYPPAMKNDRLTAADAGRPITPPEYSHAYNNFYEFFTPKQGVWQNVDDFKTEPWTIEVKGLVNKPGKYDLEELLRKMPLEERVCRFRCVERWASVMPWTGFPFAALLDYFEPQVKAKYVAMKTAYRPNEMPGIPQQSWYPWPYFDGLTLAEARNELAFLVTGAYGKPAPKQHGAPIRLITPWKFGFKQVKSIVEFNFTEEQPETFWNKLQPREYGFWANINPEVPHPRWSQAQEWLINTGDIYPTEIYNGYGDWVAEMYEPMRASEGEWLYR